MEVSVSFLKSRLTPLETINELNWTSCDYLHIDVMDGNFVEDAYEYDNISDHNLGTGYYPYGDLPSSSDAYEGDNSNRWNTD